MRTDAQRLSRAVNTIDSAEDPILPESNEPVPLGPTVRLSADPAAMAASCALRTGQAAREMGHLNVAREMFHNDRQKLSATTLSVLRGPSPTRS